VLIDDGYLDSDLRWTARGLAMRDEPERLARDGVA
jgi:hypothetical protein